MKLKISVLLLAVLLCNICNIIDANEECSSSSINGDVVQFPHESECHLFYKCFDGKKIVHKCPDGLFYNKEFRVCDWPNNVKCKNENKEWSNPNDKSKTEENEKDKESSNESGNKCSKGILQLPHENDCNLFYKCVEGQKVVQHCPEGLLYNRELEVCDWPNNVKCKSSEEIISKNIRSSLSENLEKKLNFKPRNINKLSTECPKNIDEVVLLPHETDCNLYYHCDKGKKQVLNCPGILLFNAELQVCDWPTSVNCNNPKPEPQLKCPKIECESTTTYLPYFADRRQFIRCVNGEEVVEMCPNDLVFDTKLKVCNYEQWAETVLQ